MKFNFDEPVDRHGTGSTEWDITDELIQEWGMGEKVPEDAICLSTADMDFRCAPCIRESLQKVVDFNLYGYFSAHPSIATEYVNAVTGWYEKRYHWKISPRDVQYTNGTIEALKICVNTFTRPGDGVLITPPVYYPFANIIASTGRIKVTSPLVNTDMYYTIDWKDFEKKAAEENTKMCIFCSPHNPSGRVWNPKELKQVYEICTRHNVILLVDELHGDLVRKGVEFHSMGTLTDCKNLVICSGANKSFNLAGLQASHIITLNPEYKRRLEQITSGIYPSPFTIQAIIAAYTKGEEWLEELRDYLDENLKFAVNFLHEHMPTVKVCVPEGTYILWMDFREYGLSDEEIHTRIQDKAGVIFEEGTLFDPDNGQGFVRLCLATQRAVLSKALTRITEQFE